MYVLAFDRDWTVDVNPPPNREAVPLEWVRYWAHDTAHEVWAIGNQDLVEEADIPGTVESIRRRDGDLTALGAQDEAGYYEWWPERDERLAILADLFPEADGYIVVDDLDLGHVDGWEHYHAWEFVPAVREGEIDLPTPGPRSSTVADAGDAEAAVREVLQSGYLFELTYRDEGEERTHLVRHIDPDRPSMTPLEGPPTFWFEPLGDAEQFRVRLPELVDLHHVPYDHVPDPLTEQALVTLTDIVADEPDRVPLDVVCTALENARASADQKQMAIALRLVRHVLESSADAFDALAEPTMALLQDAEAVVGTAVFRSLVDHAKTNPSDFTPYVSDLLPLAAPESRYRRQATKCLMEVAESNPAATLDAVPALATLADTAEGQPRSYAIYTLSQISAEYPEQVYPTVDTLIDAIEADDDTIQTNASTALGRIASSYPDAAAPIVSDLADLLDAEAKSVRNNAVGLLADVAQQYPAAVIDYADALAARLEDPNTHARINASIALLRAGEADPEAVRTVHDRLEAALDDTSPKVRANACALIANAEAPVATHRLRDLRANDPDETVRERAAWALQRVS